jgi:hypothetical protein
MHIREANCIVLIRDCEPERSASEVADVHLENSVAVARDGPVLHEMPGRWA